MVPGPLAEAAPAVADAEHDEVVDANAVVSYNLRAIRERRGWTQQAVAERLAGVTGRKFSQASISALECGGSDRRPRRFDAHLLYLLSEVFGVPIAYFFLPPPRAWVAGRVLGHSGSPVIRLFGAFLGRAEEVGPLDDRLAEVDVGRESSQEVLEQLVGVVGPAGWVEDYRVWRQERAEELVGRWGQDFTEALSALSRFAGQVRALRAEALGLEEDDGPPDVQRAAGGGLRS